MFYYFEYNNKEGLVIQSSKEKFYGINKFYDPIFFSKKDYEKMSDFVDFVNNNLVKKNKIPSIKNENYDNFCFEIFINKINNLVEERSDIAFNEIEEDVKNFLEEFKRKRIYKRNENIFRKFLLETLGRYVKKLFVFNYLEVYKELV